MNQFANYELLDQIHRGAHATVFRAQPLPDGEPCVIKLARKGIDSSRSEARLHHEFALTRSLDAPGIVRALGLEVGPEATGLVLELKGRSLAHVLQESPGAMPLERALTIAVQVTAALNAIHAANIIHKDIKPGNIIVDDETGEARITDFSISTQLSGERAVVSDLRAFEGTLKYVSPEQTGRMNRLIDFRTDFYALGATLYEMCTGRPPFDVDDAMELVHCHIARMPDSAASLNPAIPACLDAVISKLLSKAAEERYQSAPSLKADLEVCLEAVQSGSEPSDFSAGRHDHPERLQISQKLYGRDDDVATLMNAFARVAGEGEGSGDTELLLVAGYSGIGKSAIVNEVHRPIVAKRGYFISGKFDQFNRNIPYASMILAFQSLVGQLLTESEEELGVWREKLTTALGTNGQVIVNVIPEIELIIGEQPAIGELGPTETKNRFNLTFRNFIRVFATETRPLVLFLDDLQWADAASLNLISVILGDPDIRNLLIIGAYRDNEVDASHPLMIMLSELGDAKSRVATITLAPLAAEHVGELIADSLQTTPEACAPLTDLAMRKTHGNPFFLIQLLTNIYRQGHLSFDGAAGRWVWDMAALEELGITENGGDLMVGKVNHLQARTREVLKLAACIGNQFDLETLSGLAKKSARETADDLWEALEEGFVVPTTTDYKMTRISDDFDASAIRHRFLHDRVQQASYAIIPDDERERIHLELARQILASTPEDEIDERIFEVVSHLNLGASRIVAPEERFDAARLNLRAARRARVSTAYGPALECARAAVGFMPDDAWQVEYELSLELQSELVDLEYLTLDFEAAELASKVVIDHARDVLDQIRVYEIRIQYYVGENRMQLAIDTVKEVLELLEVPLTEDLPENLDVDALGDLPHMTDPRYLAAMRILMSSMPAVYIAAPELLPPVSFTMVRLTVQHGTSRMACYAYSLYALILAGVLSEFETGFKFAQLALEEQEEWHAVELESKVYALVYIFVHHWTRHVRDTLEPLLHGIKVGIDTGDVEYAGYNAVHYSTYYFFVGDELPSADARLQQYVDLSAQLKQEYGYNYIRVWRQLVIALRRTDVDHSLLVGEAFDERTDAEPLGPMLPVMFSMHQARAMMRYFYGDFAGATESCRQAEELVIAVAGFVTPVLNNWYTCLSLLAGFDELELSERMAAREKVAANLEALRLWADNQPENCQHKLDLVLAELKRIDGEPLEAMKLYEAAAAGARRHGYIHEEGLAYELAGRLYSGMGNDELARHHRTLAHATYARWGALGKCAAMAEEFPYLSIGRATRATSAAYPITLGSTTDSGALDLLSVVKSSQALAGEIVHADLLQKLMRIVLENVGAESGVLVLQREGDLFVEAVGSSGDADIEVMSVPLADFERLPMSIVQYVERTGKPIVLENAGEDPRFALDAYVAEKQPRSVLCAPIVHTGRVTGVFYFENNLATGVFTDERLEVLNLLSAQVSISIENAKLYEALEEHSRTLESKVEERTRELKSANRELRESLETIQAMQERIIVQEKLASLGTLTAGIAHELRNPLNFVNNFSTVQIDLVDELGEILEEQSADQVDGEVKELLADMKDTSSKIHGHGTRAASIIDNMLQHANKAQSERERCDLNEVVESSVALAYHGVRARDAAVELKLEADYDGDAGEVTISRGEISRVLINVVNNACYATVKRRETAGNGYTPTLSVSTRSLGDRVEVRVRDNGTGIPRDVLDKVFNPFFTTKPPGEGTGLGLSLSHDIVVQGHGGQMTIDTRDGEYAEVVIVLPRD